MLATRIATLLSLHTEAHHLGVTQDALPWRQLAERTGGTLVAQVTLPHPRGSSAQRNFDVLVNAPPGISSIGVDSPYYAGTIAFFGAMPGMAMDATFNVPLTKVLGALKTAKMLGASDLQIRVVPHAAVGPRLAATPPAQVRAVSVEVW